jgi:hypothetical protein
LILQLLPEEKEQNLIELSASVKETISPLHDMLSGGIAIYRTINQMPFVNLPGPSQEQVDNIEKEADEIQSAADNLEKEIAAFRSGTSDKINKVETEQITHIPVGSLRSVGKPGCSLGYCTGNPG